LVTKKRKVAVAIVLLLASSLVLGGCAPGVSQEQYDSVVAERDAAQAEIAKLEGDIEELNVQIEALTSAIDAAQAEIAKLEGDIEDLNAQIEALTTATPPEAEQTARTISSKISIPKTSIVFLIGPVKPGTILRESNPDDGQQAVELKVPGTSGKYYVFFIDDQPDFKFAHPVRYAWLNLETGDHSVINASWQPVVEQPGVTPSPFELIDSYEISDVTFYFGEGGGVGHTYDISHKPVAQLPGGFSNVGLVFDCGDKKKSWTVGNIADNMAEDADDVQEYLKANGFKVERISQYWGNAHTAFRRTKPGAMRDGLRDIIQGYANGLKCPPKDGSKCHEFFLYISGHGSADGFFIYDPSGNGNSDFVSYLLLTEWLCEILDCVKIVVFIDACYSGGAIKPLEILCLGREDCGVTIMTAADDKHTTPGGHGSTDSATEDFIEGADEDYDKDGKEGDLRDRWEEMRRQGQDYGRPQLKLCEGQKSLCSLD